MPSHVDEEDAKQDEDIEEETRRLMSASGGAATVTPVASEVDGLEAGADESSKRHDSPQQTPPPPPPQLTSRKAMYLLLAYSLTMLLIGYVFGRDSVFSTSNPSPTPPARDDDVSITPSSRPSSTTTTKSPISGPKVDNSKFYAEAKSKAQAAADRLMEYYAPKAKEVLWAGLPHGTLYGFDFATGKPSNPENFRALSDTMARLVVNRQPLKFGFIGSSVMCGHDNCYEDSFPMQLYRYLNPVVQFATGGNPMVIRNACQGGTCGDSYENQVFCIRHMVGDDVDALFYSWTYFEQGYSAVEYHELVTRWALLLPNIPPTFFYNTDTMGMGTDVDTNRKFGEVYGKYGANYFSLSLALINNGRWGGKNWGQIGDGFHNTTRDGEDPSVRKERRDSLGVVFRNWHPGPLGHQVVADLVAYRYLHALIDALERISSDPNPENTWPRVPKPLVDFPLPQFLNRDPYLKELADLEEPPGCIHFEKQTYGKPQVVIADQTNDVLNPYAKTVVPLGSGAEAWSTYEAGINWAMVPRKDRAAVGDEACAPPDHCGYLTEPAGGAPTPLVFRLPKMTVGMIVLCSQGKDGGDRLKKLAKDFTIEFDGYKLDPSGFTVFPSGKCLRVQERFTKPVKDESGHLYMKIVSSPTVSMQLSQVIVA